MSDTTVHKDPSSYLEIDANTCETLRQFLPVAEKVLPEILQQFYEHIAKRPEIANAFGPMIGQRDAMARAAAAQAKHWQNLFSGRFGENYVNSVRKIGRVHAIKGVDPRWYIGGYSFISSRLYDAIFRANFGAGFSEAAIEKTLNMVRAVNQAIMLDMALALSVYNEENKNTYNLQLEEISKEFEDSVKSATSTLVKSAENIIANAESLTTSATTLAKITEETKKKLFKKKSV